MASTYSLLKIELQTTGENDTTWGEITNDNLEALEEAIIGSADVTFASAKGLDGLPPVPRQRDHLVH